MAHVSFHLAVAALVLGLASPTYADGLRFHGSFVEGYAGTTPESSARAVIAPPPEAAESPPVAPEVAGRPRPHLPLRTCTRTRYDSFGVQHLNNVRCPVPQGFGGIPYPAYPYPYHPRPSFPLTFSFHFRL